MADGLLLEMQDTQVTDPLINQVLESRYRIEAEVGRGGMGIVYRGTDLTLSRPVAIKTILHRHADDNALNRFIKEARTLAQIENKRLVPVYAVGQDEGYHYLVMKFLEGETLATRLKREGSLAVDDVRDLVRQVCEALSVLHDLNLLHRDIKPANLMISPDGQITVMDLGIVKEIGEETSTTASITMGTPRYMPPEAIDNKPLDPRADLYSLGVIAYFASTGQVPFDGPTPMSILYKQAHEEAKRIREIKPSLPRNLENAIEIALQKSPEGRFQNAREMATAFSSHAQFRDSNSWKYSLLQAVILLVVGASLWLFIQHYYTANQKRTLSINTIGTTINTQNQTINLKTSTKQPNTQKQSQASQNIAPVVVPPLDVKPKVVKPKKIKKTKVQYVKISSSPPKVSVYKYYKKRLSRVGTTPFTLSKKPGETIKYIAKLKGFKDQRFSLSTQKSKRLNMKSIF